MKTKPSSVLPKPKHPHLDKGGFVFYWGKQIKNLAVMSGMNINEVTNWLFRDYLTRESDEVYKSIHAFTDYYLEKKEKNASVR